MNGKVTVDLNKRTLTTRGIIWNRLTPRLGQGRIAASLAGKPVEITVTSDHLIEINLSFGSRKDIPGSKALAGRLAAAGVTKLRFPEGLGYDDLREVFRSFSEWGMEETEWLAKHAGIETEIIESPKCEGTEFPISWKEFYGAALDRNLRDQIDNERSLWTSIAVTSVLAIAAAIDSIQKGYDQGQVMLNALAAALTGTMFGYLMSRACIVAINKATDRHNLEADSPGIFSPQDLSEEYETLRNYAITGADAEKVRDIFCRISSEELKDRLLEVLPKGRRIRFFCEALKLTNKFSLKTMREMAKEEALTSKQKADLLYAIFKKFTSAPENETTQLGQNELTPMSRAVNEAVDVLKEHSKEARDKIMEELKGIHTIYALEIFGALEEWE